MICPVCNKAVEDDAVVCYYCGHIFENISILIEYTIKKYSNTPIKLNNVEQHDSKIIFKNLYITDEFREIYDNSSIEDFAINFYKENGYEACFAENNYWIILFLIFYDYESFILNSSIYESVSTNFLINDHAYKFKDIDFTSINNIKNLNNHIIEAYVRNIIQTTSVNVWNHIKSNPCSLRDNFTIGDFLVASSHLTKDQLILIFERMCDDFKYYTSGLPDLIVYNEYEFFFVEVKSKNDKPSFKQIQWHKYLVEVVGIDVVIFNVDKTNVEINNIKKSYDTELLDSEERIKLKQKINWDIFKLDVEPIVDDEINERLNNKYSGKHIVPIGYYFTELNIDSFENSEQWHNYSMGVLKRNIDLLYKRIIKVYSNKHLNIIKKPTKYQLSRNREAKSFENKGNYEQAISLYLENVYEKTSSPTTYKRLVAIYKNFNQFEEIVKLMDIAIPIFLQLNDTNNVMYFLFIKYGASYNRFKLTEIEKQILGLIKEDSLKSKNFNKSKQTNLSSYFK